MKRLFNKLNKSKDKVAKLNFNLSKTEFNSLVDDLKQGDESLFEKIFLSHFNDCMSFLKINYKTSHTEAYDITMDTLIDFREGIIGNKYTYGNLRFLFTRMASQKLFKIRKKESKIRYIHECPEIEQIFESIDNEDQTVLQMAWSALEPKNRSILKKFYYENKKLNEIGKEENRSHSATRKQKERSILVLRTKFHEFKKLYSYE